MIAVCIISLLAVHMAYGLILPPCTPTHNLEVEEGNSYVLTCSDFRSDTDRVRWFIDGILIGDCPAPALGSSADTCYNKTLLPYMNPVRTERSSSTLTINYTGTADEASLKETRVVTCSIVDHGLTNCFTDYVVKPSGVQCTAEFARWNVTMNCTINRMRSSNNNYKCTWFQQRDKQTKQNLGDVNMTTTGERYKSGICLKTVPLPTVEGNYTFWMYTFLGDTHHPAPSISGGFGNRIVRPSSPTIVSCSPSGLVPENTNITCTCNTSQTGNPPGRLVWRSGTPRNINTVISTAGYGQKTLRMSQTLQRADHNRKTFRCDVDWTEQVHGSSHTTNVGYPPTKAILKINSQQNDVTVSEGERVVLECEGGRGRPPNFSFSIKDSRGRDVGGVSGTATLSNVTCQDSETYTCSADNGMGPKAITKHTLYVKCPPRGSTSLPSVNYQTESTTVIFTLVASEVTTIPTIEGSSPLSVSEVLYIVFGVTTLVLLVATVVFLVCAWRRRTVRLPCAEKTSEGTLDNVPNRDVNLSVSDVYEIPDTPNNNQNAERTSETTFDDIPNRQVNPPDRRDSDGYEIPVTPRHNPSAAPLGPYSSLEMSEVGLRSPYAQLK